MKNGQLRAVVTSTSLELGIDIGTADRVVFVHPPGSVVRLLQRLGRAGHRPGAWPRGVILAASPCELLEAAVTSDAGRTGQVECIQNLAPPLDVICQQLAGLAMSGLWSPDAAYALIQQAQPCQDLSHEEFDDCLHYLAGHHRDGTSWLPSRLHWEGDCFTIINERTARLLRRNLGTILTEDRCLLREEIVDPVRDTPRVVTVGELDVVFGDRLKPGERLVLDGRCFELRRHESSDWIVQEALGRPQFPRWLGTGAPMSSALAEKLYAFRAEAAEAARESRLHLRAWLVGQCGLVRAAAHELACFIEQQETVSEVPEISSLLLEAVCWQSCTELTMHTPLTRAANEALGLVMTKRWRDRGIDLLGQAYDLGLTCVGSDRALLDADAWRRILDPKNFVEEARATINDSDIVRQCFDRVAQTGLMVLRSTHSGPRVGGRDWVHRRLYDRVVQSSPDFVLLQQARREAEQGVCDLEAALRFVHAMPARTLCVRRLAQASPFAQHLTGFLRPTGNTPLREVAS